ncbi:MAG: TonB family protein [Deltaproteobacteria bacterium]|nr:TonB family protein [Deltaproteobacteria bacterium]
MKWLQNAACLAVCAFTATAHAQGVNGAAGNPAGAQARENIDATKLSKVPKQTKFTQADYPAEAKAKGIEADVTLLLDINDKGLIDAASVVECTAPGLGFEEAATIAAQTFEFEPAEVNGKPIAVQLAYKYHFTLAAAAPAPEAPAQPAPNADPSQTPPAQPAKPARAPVANFTGVLLERGTRAPLPGVIVTVFRDDGPQPIGYEATTDNTGHFKFFDLPEGAWKVLAEAPGYYPFRTTEDIVKGEAIDVTYYEERASYNPYDVTVTATRPRKEVSRTVISAAEIDKVPGTAGDPLSIVQNFAGVARAPLGSGQIIVRGSAPEDTKVFVDGVEVPNIYHFGGLRSVIPIGMLDGIDFYPGNYAPEYGRATAGVIDVRTKRKLPKSTHGYADVSILDTGLYLETPLGDKGSIAFAGRRSYIDFIINAAVPDDAAVNVVAAPRYYDYQLLANYRPAPAHDLRFFFFGADDSLKLLFNNPALLDTSVTDNAFSASTTFYRSATSYRYVPSPSFSNYLRVSQGRDWFNFRVGNLVFDLTTYSSQIRDTVEQKLSDRITLRYGVDMLFNRASGLIRLPPPPQEGQPQSEFDASKAITAEFNNDDNWLPAAFAEAEIRLASKLLVLPGVRLDYSTQVKEVVVQPRVTMRHSLNTQWVLKGGVGLFSQGPQPWENSADFGNVNVKNERALHYSAGAEYRPRPYLTFDITGFYKDLYNLISQTDATVVENGMNKPLRYDNKGEGQVYGMEAVIRHEFNRNFTGWIAYTLSRSKRRDSGQTESRLFDYDQPHILTVLGSYLLPRNWQVGGRFRLVSGNPRTPVVGALYNSVADRYDPVYGQANTARSGAFHQLDFRVDKKWIYDRWMLNAYLDIQNVYNRSNPEGLQYNFNYRQSKTQQGLPLVPIIGIRAEF